MTALYSILHFFVDGVCAFAMFGYFATQEEWYVNVLLYNFCAFAMQMPFGVVLDGLNGDKRLQKYQSSFAFSVLGVVLTLMGALTHPVVLGLGNALFHLGGGVGTIHEDTAKGWQGRGLGVFVAPGALGLYIGTQLAKSVAWPGWPVSAGILMVMCLVWGAQMLRRTSRLQDVKQVQAMEDVLQAENTESREQDIAIKPEKGVLWLVFGCWAVVILRSYIGMAVSFSWKTTLLAGSIAVFAVVLGKVAGGFAAAGFGMRRTVAVSLGLAAVCYLLSENMIAGVVALFLFNMTMPITLYLLVQKLKGLPGFAFGLLTFGLFLGFLPVYFGVTLPMDGHMVGALGSLVSLVILGMCVCVGQQASEKMSSVKTRQQKPEETQEAG